MEIWKDIVGFEGYYQASSLGRILSLKRTVKSYVIKNGVRIDYEKVVPYRILKQTINNTTGYLQVSISVGGVASKCRVHTLVALAFHKQIDGKDNINHKNCMKTDNRSENLEWCNKSENQKHAYDNGRLTLNGKNIKWKAELENSLK